MQTMRQAFIQCLEAEMRPLRLRRNQEMEKIQVAYAEEAARLAGKPERFKTT
jgi:hypothetical protein